MNKEVKNVIIFCAFLFALFLGETAVYYLAAGLKFGRLEIIMGSHMSSGNLQVLPSFWNLFDRFSGINSMEKVIFSIYAAGVIFIISRARKIQMNKKMKLLFIIPLAFLLLVTFAVKSFNPVVPAMSYNSRHLVPAEPFMILVISYFLILTFNSLRSWAAKGRAKAPENTTKNIVRHYGIATAILSVISILIIVAAMPYVPKHGRVNFLADHPIAEQFRYHKILNNAYAAGIPIMQEKVEAKRWKQPVDAVQDLMKKGYSQKDACTKAQVAEKDYIYSLSRVTRGDYKTFKIFTHIFWDGDFANKDNFEFPKMKKTVIKNKTYGFMVNKKVQEQPDYKRKLFSNKENYVVLMQEKPIKLKQIKLKELL